ncbi:uncharacterized protein [Dysidea avara]|uniref:uncharacterized protein isoform X3 n=1 Tax=Dysidea avara TaxID=196820 RepID=UPI00331AA566
MEASEDQAYYADVCLKAIEKYTNLLYNLSDLDSLLLHFEESNIITIHQQVEIENSSSPTEDRMKMLLDNISLPLQNGSTDQFDSMLKILMEHGVDDTKSIGSLMQNEVKGFAHFISRLQAIEVLMPMDFMLTTDILNDCFTVSQVSDVFNSKDSIAANQLIIKYLTANLSNTKDLLELCTRLQKISTSPKLDRVISDLEKSCVEVHHEYELPDHDHRPTEDSKSSLDSVFESKDHESQGTANEGEAFQAVSDIGQKPVMKTQESDSTQHNDDKDMCFKYQPPPSRPHHHIRRQYLFDKIARIICSNSESILPGKKGVSVILTGAGGFGKTTVALDLCHHPDVKDFFPNGIIFIELGPQPCDPSKILNEHYCQMTGKAFEYINDVEDKIKEVTKIYKNVLVIIDDVWVVDDARPIVEAFFNCTILLTTRNPNIGIPYRKTITIESMSLKESVFLMTKGILEYSELSTEDVKVFNELAVSTHQWPLLLSLIRGHLSHSLNDKNYTLRNAIAHVQTNLANKGLIAFDIKETHNIRQKSVHACIEVSLGLLDNSVKDKLFSLILYTGIGGSLPSRAVQCLWDVSAETARKTVSSLELYGLVFTKSLKPVPPYYQAAYKFLTVHSVISDYIISSIESKTVVQLSPFLSLHTEELICSVEELLFQESHMVDSLKKSKFLNYNKLKMEHIVLPYYMKDINMHVLHDPHLALLILQNIQSILNGARYCHLLPLFNEEIVTLSTECHNALSHAQGLSRKVNLHFQLCFRVKSFNNLIPILKEYLKTQFIVSTVARCVKLAESISTQCDAKLKAEMTNICGQFQILTVEDNIISLEKLPRFQLYVLLHKKITDALLQGSNDEIENLYNHIATGKFDKEIKLIHDKYLPEIQDGNYGAFQANDVAHHFPPNNIRWIGGVETQLFDDSEGVFYSFNHEVTVTVPPGAIPNGRQAELKFAATLTPPVKLAQSVTQVSAIFWLCMDVELKKPIKLCMPHSVCVETMEHARNLYFAKIAHSSLSEGCMNIIDGGEFKDGESFGVIEIDHFCYYCIVKKTTPLEDIPENEYKIITMKLKKPMIDHWKCDVCIVPSIPTCRMHLEEQYQNVKEEYTCDEEITKFHFRFHLMSKEVQLDIDKAQFNGDAEIHIISGYDKILKEDVDFRKYYGDNNLLRKLKENMDTKLYPSRFQIEILKRNLTFFQSRHYLTFSLKGGKRKLCRKIVIEATDGIPERRTSPSHCSRYDYQPSTDNASAVQLTSRTSKKEFGVKSPKFATQPFSQSADLQQQVQLTCSATGYNVNYQWTIGSGSFPSKVTGINTNTLVIPDVRSSDDNTYTCTISNDGGSVTSNTAKLTVTGLPEVTVDPPSRSVEVTQPVKFTTTESGVGKENFSYQWRHNGEDINGETSNTLTIDSVTKDDGGTYECMVKNEYGDYCTSNVAKLGVKPVIITNPLSHQVVNLNSNLDYLSLTCTATEAISYYWEKENAVIPHKAAGVNTNTLTIFNLSLEDAGNYRCIVSNDSDLTFSKWATITVKVNAPKFTAQPSSQTIDLAQHVKLTCSATGYNVNYQWTIGSGSFPSKVTGINTNTLVIPDVRSSDDNTYTCTISNDGGSVTSNTAKLTVTGLPEVTVDPPSRSVEVTQPAKFTTTESGVGKENFSYQWRHNGEDINGETSNTLTIDSVTKDDGGTYEYMVKNEYGDCVTSNTSKLVVGATLVKRDDSIPSFTAGVSPTFNINGNDKEFQANVVAQHFPPNDISWIGGVETQLFDDSEGIFYSFNHEVTVTVPPGAIPNGRQAELKFAATLAPPVKLAQSVTQVSAIFWLCMDVELKKPIKLCMPHSVCVETMEHARNLYFAKLAHSSLSEGCMNIIDGGEFKDGEHFGVIEIDHFCYYCIVKKTTPLEDIPKNEYKIITMKLKKPMIDHWKCDVCIIPSIPTCRMELEEQYQNLQEEYTCDEEITEFHFRFHLLSKEVQLDIDKAQFKGDAEIHIISGYDKILKEDVDFRKYYGDNMLLRKLKENMDTKLYPPRFRIEILKRNLTFFQSRHYLTFSLKGGKRKLCREIAIGATDGIPERGTSPSHCSRSDYQPSTDNASAVQLNSRTCKKEFGDEICIRPTKKMLGRFQTQLTPNWMYIRYEFVESSVVDTVECTCKDDSEKCIKVLSRWIEIDKDACYCKLLRVLQQHQFNSTAEELKKSILKREQ